MPHLTEQRIVIYSQADYFSDETIEHGIQLSRIFNKELCFFRNILRNDKVHRKTAQHQLSELIRKWKPRLPDIPFSSLVLNGPLSQTITTLADKYDAVLLIVPSAAPGIKEKLSALHQSAIPFLFVGTEDASLIDYNRILVPADSRKVVKNMVLWASYLARFNQATVKILNAGHQKKNDERLTARNNRFTRDLFQKFNLKIQFKDSPKRHSVLLAEAYRNCISDNINLLIIPSAPDSSLLAYLFGPPEQKILKKAGRLPVLCINSERDMYILCD